MVKVFRPYNEASSNRRPHLLLGESLGDRITVIDDEQSFYVWPISNPNLGKSDRVLLDIYSRTKPNVLIGGNPLRVDVLEGVGKVSMIDLSDGALTEKMLEPGVQVRIPSDNIAYWYENKGDKNLLLRDTCNGFDPIHEPNAEDVVSALTRILLG